MRFLVDEDLPRSLVSLLSRFGHEGVHVIDAGIRGSSDEGVLRFANDNGLCLVTGDLDFSDVRTYPPEEHEGIIVLRAPRNATSRTIEAILESLLVCEELIDTVKGRLFVVEHGRVRIRPVGEL